MMLVHHYLLLEVINPIKISLSLSLSSCLYFLPGSLWDISYMCFQMSLVKVMRNYQRFPLPSVCYVCELCRT